VMHDGSFTFRTGHAFIIGASISPESDSDLTERTSGSCNVCAGDCLEIHIKALDLTALRAALNTWLRLVQIADEMIMVVEQEEKAGWGV